jgi:hypothetical protein
VYRQMANGESLSIQSNLRKPVGQLQLATSAIRRISTPNVVR